MCHFWTKLHKRVARDSCSPAPGLTLKGWSIEKGIKHRTCKQGWGPNTPEAFWSIRQPGTALGQLPKGTATLVNIDN